jgi:cytochrome c oxidase subunit 1
MGIVLVSGAVWAHHMFVSGMNSGLLAPFLVTTEIISVPTGLIFLSALGTIWMGRLWLKTPMLFALAVIFNFLIGGVTGIHLADVPTDLSLSDTYFVVAHFHYTIIGAEIFALFAGVYYWFPKITGRMYDEGLAQLHFWLMFIAFNVTFLPMFWAGFDGMNRRVATYTPDITGLNVFISFAAFALGSSFIFFVVNMVRSLLAGERAPANPWQARTLEWMTSSPPPPENFQSRPVVLGGPYDYGQPSAQPHAAFSPAGAADASHLR